MKKKTQCFDCKELFYEDQFCEEYFTGKDMITGETVVFWCKHCNEKRNDLLLKTFKDIL